MNTATKLHLASKAGNRNHYICKVIDTLNPNVSGSPTYSCYFDGTQAQAIKHFLKDEKVRKYADQPERYDVSIRANSITLSWSEK